MPPPDLINLFLVPLNLLEIRYMITGAVAAVIYGEPRFTRDLDLILDLRPGDARRLVQAFAPDTFYVPPSEVVDAEAQRPLHGHFNVIHHETALKADCYMVGQDPLHEWAFSRRVRLDVGGVPVWVAPVEYVILRKLQWHRDSGASRHIDDVRAMLRISGDSVDQATLADWITRLNLEREWRLVAVDRAQE